MPAPTSTSLLAYLVMYKDPLVILPTWGYMSGEGTLPPSIVNWLSGLAGGTAQVIAGHPFDTIKV